MFDYFSQVQAVLLLLGGRELNPGLGSGASSSAPYSKVGTGDGELSFFVVSVHYVWQDCALWSSLCIFFPLVSEVEFSTPGGIFDAVQRKAEGAQLW